jgi:hypothetical protein
MKLNPVFIEKLEYPLYISIIECLSLQFLTVMLLIALVVILCIGDLSLDHFNDYGIPIDIFSEDNSAINNKLNVDAAHQRRRQMM